MFFRKIVRIFKKKHSHLGTLAVKPSKDPNLTALREQLFNSIERPQNLVCPISQEIPDDPVVTPNGHVFNRTEIKIWVEANHDCPITREKLEVNDLQDNVEINNLTQEFCNEFRTILDAINLMSLADESAIKNRIDNFNASTKSIDSIAQEKLESIRQSALIKMLVNHLSLDIHNLNHLFFWHQLCNINLDDYNIVHLDDNNSDFCIPRLVYDLMIITDQPYETKEQLKQALDQRRHQNTPLPNFADKPLVYISSFFRLQTGSQISLAEDIESLRLN